MNRFMEEPREKYKELMSSPAAIDKILQEGAEKARAVSAPFLKEVKRKIGFTV
ncbi:tryptophanyl-tRNA synthetase [Mycobacteroides abscessus subsp. abscessus]|nr:tryptophanyl-tRNA synthetase [Mycobacteroides abscessus subsp. abscessus]